MTSTELEVPADGEVQPLGGTTTGGLPYPASSDPLNAGADAIKALAQALETRGGGRLIQTGHPSQTWAGASTTVAFPVPFKTGTVPIVLANGGAGSSPNNTSLLVGVNVTTATWFQATGLVVSGVGNPSGWVAAGFVCEVNYIAIGVAP